MLKCPVVPVETTRSLDKRNMESFQNDYEQNQRDNLHDEHGNSYMPIINVMHDFLRINPLYF